jgi:GTP-binding protein HflX
MVFTKCDKLNSQEEMVKKISEVLGTSNPVLISSKSGYGITKLKNIISQHSYAVSRAK